MKNDSKSETLIKKCYIEAYDIVKELSQSLKLWGTESDSQSKIAALLFIEKMKERRNI